MGHEEHIVRNVKIIIGYYCESKIQYHFLKNEFEEQLEYLTLLLRKIKNTNQFNSFEIIWFDSSSYSRLYYINKFAKQFILFLDHDCVLSDKALSWLLSFNLEKIKGNVVVSGTYENPKPTKYLQKVHNSIANQWLHNSRTRRILGGIFLINSNELFNRIQINNNFFWGGEDAQLATLLYESKYHFLYCSELTAVHTTSGKIHHFIRRGYLHGLNFIASSEGDRKKSLDIRSLAVLFESLILFPGVLLHYFCFSIGRLVGITHLRHKQ